MVNSKKLLSLIGLATRARKVVSGEFSTEKSVKSGRSRMVIVSEEASDNTKKMFTNMCAHYKSRSICLVQRMNSVMPWGRSFALLSLWRMQGSQSQWQH